MAGPIEYAQPSHILMSTLWDRHKKLFDNQLCATKLDCLIQLDPRYYRVAKDSSGFLSLSQLGYGVFRYVKRLTPDHYSEPLRHLLNVEEAYKALSNRRYDLAKAKIKLSTSTEDDGRERGQLVQIQYTRLATSGVSVYPGDQVVLKHEDCYHVETVNRVKGDIIRTKIIHGPPKCYKIDKPVWYIIFCPSGLPKSRCLDALKFFDGNESKKQLLKQMLFNLDDDEQLKINLRKTRPKIVVEENGLNNNDTNNGTLSPTLQKLEQSLARCNPAQRSAICNILAGRCRPKPYILFGPPGTGKTKTIVECVIQAHLRRPDFSILVCVSSNTCANHLADLLDKSGVFESQTIARLMPQQRLNDLDDAQVREYYTDDQKTNSNVVVTTNIKAGSIRHRQFDYVFVDEAGHAMEPEALIPATRLNRDGVFVLSGDPKQLRPVIEHRGVSQSCLRYSMLERLYKSKPYKDFDKNYITTLSESYRSDTRLMDLWNVLFYDNNLKNLGPETPQSLLDEFKLKGNPIAYKSNSAPEAAVTMSSSRRNETEVNIILDLVTKLKKHVRPEQIGIISMYKLQAKEIRKALLERLYESARSRSQNQNDGDYVPCRTRRRNKKKNKNTEQKQVEHQSQENDSLEESWLELERMAVEMMKARFAGGGNRTAASSSTNRETSSTETTQSGATNNDLPLLVDTVDAFQGNEREVIIISTVRSDGDPRSYGFIYEPRRFNVAVSRAKWLLIAVGNSKVLKPTKHWGNYIKKAQEI